MQIKRSSELILNNDDLDSLACILDFCSINEIIKKEDISLRKGYTPYQIKKAADLYDELFKISR